jgi:hypothetical protein
MTVTRTVVSGFDRAAGHVVEESRTVDLDDNWFWKIAETYHVGLAPG